MQKTQLLLLPVLATLALSSPAASPFEALPVNGQLTTVLKNQQSYLNIGLGGWGAKWSYCSFSGKSTAQGNAALAKNTSKIGSAELSFDTQTKQKNSTALEMACRLETSEDVETTMIMIALDLDAAAFQGGTLQVETANGTSTTQPLPLGRGAVGKQVRQCIFTDASGLKTRLSFEPACTIVADGQLRILLAEGHFKSSQPVELTLAMDLPGKTKFYASTADYPTPDLGNWFAFTPTGKDSPKNEISMASWLEKPAGKYGRITRREDRLLYNGKPIKLWGINNCYATCAPDKDLAGNRASFYAKNGINSVRLHKYADGHGWEGIQSARSFTRFDPEALAKMDYYVAQLKEHGIYTKLSATFGVNIGPDDLERIPYAAEFEPMKHDRIETKHGSIYLSTELQDMQIEQVVNLLNHTNPDTGLTYAKDPAIAVVELYNEDSALFHGTMAMIGRVPTLRKRAEKEFGDWLKARYGTEENLLAAWGPNALNGFANEGYADESWAEKTIVPLGNPWFYDPVQLDGSQAGKKARLLDTMLFYYELQNKFYDRYVQAIRTTGYTGEILASNWQAGRAFSHYYNLHSDARIGLIDRHNYFGGRNGSKIRTAAMVSTPGSAILSTGMQQVGNRPFMLSEWIHVAPTEWGAEGVALIGAYGMGLQGWDVSYIFQNKDTGTFTPQINKDMWEATSPQVMGLFPAVARQVLRQDIRESKVVASRYVHLPSLHEGKLGFDDQVQHAHDTKSFTTDKIPNEAMAVARCVVDFTDDYRDTPAFDMAPYQKDGGLLSSTKELFWKKGKSGTDGFFTIDTPATQAVVGFSGGQKHRLRAATIESRTRFSAIYITAREPDKNLMTSDHLLVTAIARARNTGMKIIGDSLLLDRGTAPVLMEPVQATITLRRKGAKEVIVLNHDGERTGKTLPIRNGRFEIDGARDKTCYYLVTY